MKRCRICLVDKTLDNFYVSPRNKGGYATACKACEKAMAAERWVKNKDAMYARNKRWAQANPEKLYEYQMKKSKEKRTEIHRRWAQKNKEAVRLASQRRRAKIKNNGVYEILPREIKKLYNSPCFYCGSNEKITADHVIPISRGGAHSIGNLLPACLECNSSKHDYTIMEWKLRGGRKNIN